MFCYRESLHDICHQLDVEVEKLYFDEQASFCINDLEDIELYLMRFDLLFKQPEITLSELLKQKIDLKNANISEFKWYAAKYKAFKNSLTVSPKILINLHESKKDLITLFYPEKPKACDINP